MTGDDPFGKRSLYSTALRRPGTVLVECSSCDSTARVSYLEIARAHLPIWLWMPLRRHSRLLRCPVCDRRTWVRIDWLG